MAFRRSEDSYEADAGAFLVAEAIHALLGRRYG